jgi:hypothetical protein
MAGELISVVVWHIYCIVVTPLISHELSRLHLSAAGCNAQQRAVYPPIRRVLPISGNMKPWGGS